MSLDARSLASDIAAVHSLLEIHRASGALSDSWQNLVDSQTKSMLQKLDHTTPTVTQAGATHYTFTHYAYMTLYNNYTHACTLQYIIQSKYTHIQASELVQLISLGPFPSSQKAALCEKVFERLSAYRGDESASPRPNVSKMQHFTSIEHYCTAPFVGNLASH